MQTLAPPPRPVPLSLRIINVFNGVTLFGWIFFGFGMLFFYFFGGNADISFLTFRGPHPTVPGQVTKVDDTHASEGDERVHAHSYQYSVAGRTLSGTSYTTGPAAEVGQPVVVEYDPAEPAQSRIAGMRRAVFGPWALILGILPLVGLLIMVFAMRSGARRNRLLRDGLLAMGQLKSKEATNMKVNRRRVYALTFEFTARDGTRHTAEARSSTPESLEDEAREPLLYDPANPSVAYLLDDAPARPGFDGTGALVGRPAAAVGALLVPALFTGAAAMYIWSILQQ
jgi:hypothetical protein